MLIIIVSFFSSQILAELKFRKMIRQFHLVLACLVLACCLVYYVLLVLKRSAESNIKQVNLHFQVYNTDKFEQYLSDL